MPGVVSIVNDKWLALNLGGLSESLMFSSRSMFLLTDVTKILQRKGMLS